MTTDLMKDKVIDAYPGSKWANKVNQMADNQVIALYYRLKKEGKIV